MLKIYIFKSPKQTTILLWELSNFQKMIEIEIKLFLHEWKNKNETKTVHKFNLKNTSRSNGL